MRDRHTFDRDALMALWHRAPRAVYQVYGEDEYLAGEDSGPQVESGQPPQVESQQYPPVERARPHGSPAGRLVGLGLLAGVTACALGLVVMNTLHGQSSAPRPGVARRIRNTLPGTASVGESIVGSADGPSNSDPSGRSVWGGRVVARGRAQAPVNARVGELAASMPSRASSPSTHRRRYASEPPSETPRPEFTRPAALQSERAQLERSRPEAISSPDVEFGFER